MKKSRDKESTLNLVVRLFLICAIAALLLGATYQATKEPIEQQEIAAITAARQEVLPEADSFEDMSAAELAKLAENPDFATITGVSTGLSGGAGVGYVITVNTKGYSSGLKLAIGLDNEGTVVGVKVTESGETPGLGSKGEEPEFLDQYTGVDTDKYTVVKSAASAPGEIVAIAGATKTTDGITGGVNTALELYNSVLKDGEGK